MALGEKISYHCNYIKTHEDERRYFFSSLRTVKNAVVGINAEPLSLGDMLLCV